MRNSAEECDIVRNNDSTRQLSTWVDIVESVAWYISHVVYELDVKNSQLYIYL